MSQAVFEDVELSGGVRRELDRICQRLSELLEGQLHSVTLFGSVARGAASEEDQGKVQVLVLLHKMDREALDAAASVFQRVAANVNLGPLILSQEELRSSTDVFPVKFLDMKLCHNTIFGEDPLEKLEIVSVHLRLRCEQEFKNLLLKLRNHYLHHSRQVDSLRSALGRGISAYLNTLRAALHLRNGVTPLLESELTELASSQLELDDSVLERALALRSNRRYGDLETVQQLYHDFLELVRETAGVVDRL